MKELRIIADTNIWISILIGKRLSKFIRLIDHGNIKIILSRELLMELNEVVSRPKFRKYFSEYNAKGFITALARKSELYSITDYPKICRDPKDDYLLELSRLADADYLVTGDEDLLVLQKIGNTKIVSVSAFKDVLSVLYN